MIKLIVCDMDGTLLNDEHQLGGDFWETEAKLAAAGIQLAIASGRQYYNLLEQFERIKDRTIFLADNGSYMVHQDVPLHIRGLDKDSANRFVDIGRKIEGANLIVSGRESAYVESADERFLNEVGKYFKRMKIVNDLTGVDDTVLKVTLCDFNNSETNSYPYYKAFEDRYKVAIAGKIWLDISDWNANKGEAVRQLQNRLGVGRDETLVFGDYLNDLEMMGAAKYSYAMKNAHPQIINAAGFVTRFTNNENGVVETIRELGLV